MDKTLKLLYTLITVVLFVSCNCNTILSDKQITNKVIDWQIANFSDSIAPKPDWVHAALYKGMVEWAKNGNNEKIWDFLKNVGQECNWDMLDRIYDADDLCVGQTYIALYEREGNPEMIAKIRNRINYVMENPDNGPMRTKKGKYSRTRWGWCDALFMAPPVYAKMAVIDNDSRYLDFCFNEFKVTTDTLYNREHHLFHRDIRLINNLEENGKKVFWARGNGWVYAGLTFMLDTVPEEHPSYEYYKQLFLEMSEPILQTQDSEGEWHSGMYDPDHWNSPETSAGGFFVYGFAWGVNRGILGEEYRIAARKGWKALRSHVNENGRLGHVQQIGHAPVNTTPQDNMPYGTGAFLLAASQIIQMK